MLHYAGIGSRKTPKHILDIMHHIAAYLASQGWILRSGGAPGADSAFEEGARIENGKTEIFLPWFNFRGSDSELHPRNYPFTPEEREFAAQFHPAWHRCSPTARLLHQRNTRILLGIEHLHGKQVTPVKFVIAWTENGMLKGGTSQALRIAQALDIPIFNLGTPSNSQELEAMILKIDEIQTAHKEGKVIS